MSIITLPGAHDWSITFVEDAEYLTSIITSIGQREQRSGKRRYPRLGYTLQMLMTGDDLYTMRAFLATDRARQALIPIWSQGTKMVSHETAGPLTTLLVSDRLHYRLRIGDYVMAIHPDGRRAQLQVAAISSPYHIRFTANPSFGYAQGLKLVPLVLCYLGPMVEAVNITAGVSRFTVQGLQVINPVAEDWTTAIMPAAAMTHTDGLEVLIKTPQWAEAIASGNGMVGERFDYGVGVYGVRAVSTTPYAQGTLPFLAKNREDLIEWSAFFDRRRGRQKPYIQPSWIQSFEILDTPPAAAYDFLIRGEAWRELIDRKHTPYIVVRHLDGHITVHTISAVGSDGGDNTTITTAPNPWVESYSPRATSMVCFGYRARLDADLMSIQHTTDGVAPIEIPFVSVEV